MELAVTAERSSILKKKTQQAKLRMQRKADILKIGLYLIHPIFIGRGNDPVSFDELCD